ncbi:tryptophan synthase subunit beta [Sulfitobacter sp. S0837]|uniref:tryptophan synthase subunit beta n=1 Tax=Sulfitobacter maritimus TaxID=2741719 RepID=UPI0015839234|nr:tryptophan synthase subunit beta [Sulfitobacter maritimus]NUH65065.1 tryptophan synthase subunit beta [Sulfitobacter maritimus]
MKKTLTTTALILATAGTAAFAQGMEGHQIGYNDKAADEAIYSSRSVDDQELKLQRDVFLRGQFRSDTDKTQVITVFPTPVENLEDGDFPR